MSTPSCEKRVAAESMSCSTPSAATHCCAAPTRKYSLNEAIFQALAQRDTALAKKIMQQSQWNINEGVVSIAKGWQRRSTYTFINITNSSTLKWWKKDLLYANKLHEFNSIYFILGWLNPLAKIFHDSVAEIPISAIGIPPISVETITLPAALMLRKTDGKQATPSVTWTLMIIWRFF